MALAPSCSEIVIVRVKIFASLSMRTKILVVPRVTSFLCAKVHMGTSTYTFRALASTKSGTLFSNPLSLFSYGKIDFVFGHKFTKGKEKSEQV